jgi:branched-chain amino acid transport system permease protein
VAQRIQTSMHGLLQQAKWPLLVLLLGLLAVLPLFVPPLVLHILILFFMYVTLAESWNLISGYTGKVNFGHVTFLGIGAYTSLILLKDYGLSPFYTCLLGGLLAALTAVVVGYPLLRLRGPYFAISMLSLSFIFTALAFNLSSLTEGGRGISVRPFASKVPFYYFMLVCAVIAVGAIYKISRSKFGLGLISIREDEEVADSLGVNTTLYKILAFAGSAVLPGIVGGIYAYYMSYMDPKSAFSFSFTLNSIVMCLLGGSGTVLGPIIGAVILRSMSEFVSYLIPGEFYKLLVGALFIGLILYLPGGIMSLFTKEEGSDVFAQR